MPGLPTMWQHIPHCTKKDGVGIISTPTRQWSRKLGNFYFWSVCREFQTFLSILKGRGVSVKAVPVWQQFLSLAHIHMYGHPRKKKDLVSHPAVVGTSGKLFIALLTTFFFFFTFKYIFSRILNETYRVFSAYITYLYNNKKNVLEANFSEKIGQLSFLIHFEN